MEIGKRIYFDKLTGDILANTGERSGDVIELTIDQDIANYKALSERNRDTFDLIELKYEQLKDDFRECNGYRVNPKTKELEFSYPDPTDPEAPQVFVKPLTEQLADLKVQNGELMLAVVELAAANEADKIETQLAIAELATILTGGVA